MFLKFCIFRNWLSYERKFLYLDPSPPRTNPDYVPLVYISLINCNRVLWVPTGDDTTVHGHRRSGRLAAKLFVPNAEASKNSGLRPIRFKLRQKAPVSLEAGARVRGGQIPRFRHGILLRRRSDKRVRSGRQEQRICQGSVRGRGTASETRHRRCGRKPAVLQHRGLRHR